MHLLNTDLITEKFPTQILGECFDALDESVPPKHTAYLSVQVNDQQHVCEVQAPASLYEGGELNRPLYEEWMELINVTAPVARTASLIAVPSKDVIGTAHFAITQIDLRVEDGENRFFVEVIQ